MKIGTALTRLNVDAPRRKTTAELLTVWPTPATRPAKRSKSAALIV
jgi:hypothetical protein